MKISVVIRNKNQETALMFSLKNLVARYAEDVDEIVVIDNLSTGHKEAILFGRHINIDLGEVDKLENIIPLLLYGAAKLGSNSIALS